jgi:NADH pyrophosphatase NudC (nudix superfamily)
MSRNVAAKRNEQILSDLLKEDTNRQCADCGQKGALFDCLDPVLIVVLIRDKVGFMEHWCLFVYQMWWLAQETRYSYITSQVRYT